VGAPLSKERAEIRKAAVAFEGMLMSTMFQNMRKSTQPSTLLGDSGQAKGTLTYLMDQAIVDSAMKGGKSWGLAQRLEEAWMARYTQADSKLPKPVHDSRSSGR
jgi:Rod binding domain-containing protein